ncbi:MAG: hypothetical protein RIQ52_926 [Pseudomonadota bacterium]
MNMRPLLTSLLTLMVWLCLSGSAVADPGVAMSPISYRQQIQPVLESRCAVCHSCYDAPCQVKMESWFGLQRGGIREVVYDGGRLDTMAPTRLFIDGRSESDWRTRGFHPVLSAPESGAGEGLLASMLTLKQQHPLALDRSPLGARFDVSADRALHCPAPDDMPDYALRHPSDGMPYALPALKPDESAKLLAWLRQGAPYDGDLPVSAEDVPLVEAWERWLNVQDRPRQLLVRYLYEHLFSAHLHLSPLEQMQAPRFFRLVRSKTPPGLAIDEIASVRPFDDPGVATFYYRLQPLNEIIVDKSHIPYDFTPGRRARYEQLFPQDTQPGMHWPDYSPEVAANPFIAYQSLSQKGRYQFLLDDSYFFFAGFMKGPVCHGQAAVNVIQDRFWVAFADPDTDPVSSDSRFVTEQGSHLRLPSERENSPGLADITYTYGALQRQYLEARNSLMQKRLGSNGPGLQHLWRGQGGKGDAMLTVFRHFDSASVRRGWIGDIPTTGWVVDYPLMERIHYLLVAGFDVFGNVRHQLATRFFMDYLRMEAETSFLAFLPADVRKTERDHWYQGFMGRMSTTFYHPLTGLERGTSMTYTAGEHAKAGFFRQVRQYVGGTLGHPDPFFCADCVLSPLELRLLPLAHHHGAGLEAWPELMFLRIRSGGEAGHSGQVYSLVRNAALSNLSTIFLESARRIPEEDSLTLVSGFVGSYPNFYLDVDAAQVEALVGELLQVRTDQDFRKIADHYGVRRTDPGFWEVADWLTARHRQDDGWRAGIFDLNRYEDR